MAKFNNKYRIESTRLKNWDYGNNGLYFITICTAHRNWWFGEIKNGVMRLSETGKIAHRFWNEIPDHFPIVELGEFIVMPNHIHGIVIIDKNDDPHNNRTHETHVETPNLGVSTPPVKNAANMKNVNPIKTIISTDDATPNNINRHRTYNASQKWKPETLGVIINQYKRMVSINTR